ncbi:MAG: LptF/LptG family permease [Deinococcaceae bacterium]
MLMRYLYREILPPFFVGIALYSTLFLFGYFFIGSQWLDGVAVQKILLWLLYRVPDTLVKVFPMAVVLMVVVALGRLMSEHELVAMGAGGLSIKRIAAPVLVVAAVTSVGALLLSEYVTPKTELESRRLWYEELPQNPQGLLRLEGSTFPLGGGLELYFQTFDPQTQEMRNVRISQWKNRLGTLIFADKALYQGNDLVLFHPLTTTINFGQLEGVGLASNFEETQRALRKALPLFNTSTDPNSKMTLKTGTSRAEAIAKFADGFAAETHGLTQMWRDIQDKSLTPKERFDARVSFGTTLALPFANLVLALVSLPFAMRFGRGTGVALGISVLIVIVYYVLFALGRSFALIGLVPPELGVWLANLFFGGLGWWMLSR